ncbi:MAG: hypothetical protein GX677_00185 [Treponema sp.]|nr:hypothetical protein [Treponema sp.]
MKKIIGIIGIAAVLASSMFAAEVKAKVRLTGSIIDYSEADKYNFRIYKDKDDSTKDLLTVMGTRAKFMTLDTHQAENWNPIFDISVSTDVAGAGFKFYNTSGTWEYGTPAFYVNDGKWNVWFKPFDNFKVTMGNFDICLNQEQIDWANEHTGLGGDGYVFEYAMGDFTFDFIMNTGWGKSWIYAPYTMNDFGTTDKKNYSLMGTNRLSETSVKGAYKSPVGTISASVTYKGTDTVDVVTTDGKKSVTAAKFIDYFKVAAGWNVGNLFGDNITGFVNAWTTINTKKFTSGWKNYSAYGLTDFSYDSTITGLDKIGAEVYAQMTMDAFKFQIFVPFELNMMPVTDLTINPAQDSAIPLYKLFTNYIVAKATYSMSNGVSPYVYVKFSPWAGATHDFDYAGVTFKNSYAKPSIQVKPGVTGKFGICEYEVAVDSTITLGGDPTVQAFTFKVPVTLTVQF